MTATSPVITESYYTGGFLVSEANGQRSRDIGTLLNAGTVDLEVQAGMVLSPKVGTIAVTAAGTNGATGVPGTIAIGSVYTPGTFTLAATDATHFAVTDPGGRSLPSATVGAAYTDAEIKWGGFANGTGTFVAGDKVTLVVPSPSGTFEPTGTATLPATAVLFNRVFVPASGSRKATIISRAAEVTQAELRWDSTITNAGTATAGFQATAISQLGSAGIIAR